MAIISALASNGRDVGEDIKVLMWNWAAEKLARNKIKDTPEARHKVIDKFCTTWDKNGVQDGKLRPSEYLNLLGSNNSNFWESLVKPASSWDSRTGTEIYNQLVADLKVLSVDEVKLNVFVMTKGLSIPVDPNSPKDTVDGDGKTVHWIVTPNYVD